MHIDAIAKQMFEAQQQAAHARMRERAMYAQQASAARDIVFAIALGVAGALFAAFGF